MGIHCHLQKEKKNQPDPSPRLPLTLRTLLKCLNRKSVGLHTCHQYTHWIILQHITPFSTKHQLTLQWRSAMGNKLVVPNSSRHHVLEVAWPDKWTLRPVSFEWKPRWLPFQDRNRNEKLFSPWKSYTFSSTFVCFFCRRRRRRRRRRCCCCCCCCPKIVIGCHVKPGWLERFILTALWSLVELQKTYQVSSRL